jgi:DNA repair exonuclease SbcCD ATPase subunit
MQQMLQQLLASQAKLKADQARMVANREDLLVEISACMKSNKDLLARLEARIETNKGKNREDLKGMMAEMNAKMDGNQAEMKSTVYAMWPKLKETIQHGMKVIIQPIQPELDETTACNEVTETEPDPQMMQSIEEH